MAKIIRNIYFNVLYYLSIILHVTFLSSELCTYQMQVYSVTTTPLYIDTRVGYCMHYIHYMTYSYPFMLTISLRCKTVQVLRAT
jgi:hypothetical protein